jgi:hypothetical protein
MRPVPRSTRDSRRHPAPGHSFPGLSPETVSRDLLGAMHLQRAAGTRPWQSARSRASILGSSTTAIGWPAGTRVSVVCTWRACPAFPAEPEHTQPISGADWRCQLQPGRAERSEPRSGGLDCRRVAELPDVADVSPPRGRAGHGSSGACVVPGCRRRAARLATRPMRRFRRGCRADRARRSPQRRARWAGRRGAWARTRCRRCAARARRAARRHWWCSRAARSGRRS